MISDILCSKEPTRLEKTLLFFEAVRNTGNFNVLMESVGEPQTATDVANCMFQVENGEAGVFINELLNGRPMIESYTPPIFKVFTDPNIPTIRTLNGGEYVCRTANPSIASEKYAICESIAQRVGLLCTYLESEQAKKDPRIAQKLQNIADLVNWGDESDPTSLDVPLRKEITDWFLLSKKTLPSDAQLMSIIRGLITDRLDSERNLTPSHVDKKLSGTAKAAEKYGIIYDPKTGKKSDKIREVFYDVTENPNRFGTVDFDDEYEDYANSTATASGIPEQVSNFISKLYEKARLANINDRYLDSVIGNLNAADSFLYIASDTEDGRIPQDISHETMLDALETALNVKAKADPSSRKIGYDIWNIAMSLPTNEMASGIGTALSKETMLKRLEAANEMQEQNLDGEVFSMSDLKNIVPVKGEGDSVKTAHENTNALMIGVKQLPGMSLSVLAGIASPGFNRPLQKDDDGSKKHGAGKFYARLAKFDNAANKGDTFKKTFAAYEAVRYFYKIIYNLWVMAVFGPKSRASSNTWANRTWKISEAIQNMDARNLIEYATKISDPNLVKAGAPQIDENKLHAIYEKVKSTVAEADSIISKGNAKDDEIRNLWAFGFKASFDTGIEETEETATV